MTQQEQNMLKAIQITKPYNAMALVDGWLCIKYLDGGEESISTFADVSKGDIILYGNATCSRPAAPEFTPYIPGHEQVNTYRCCEVCPNVLSKPVFRVNCLQPQHDATIRNQTLDAFVKRVRQEFTQDDDEEWYLSAYDFEDCIDEFKNSDGDGDE